jgi:hypothetical protein
MSRRNTTSRRNRPEPMSRRNIPRPEPMTRNRSSRLGISLNNKQTPPRLQARSRLPQQPPNGPFEQNVLNVENGLLVENGPPEPPEPPVIQGKKPTGNNFNKFYKKTYQRRRSPLPLPSKTTNPLREDSEVIDFIEYLDELKKNVSKLYDFYHKNRTRSYFKSNNMPKQNYITAIISKIDQKIEELQRRENR